MHGAMIGRNIGEKLLLRICGKFEENCEKLGTH
jgi:hypothetical protein